jgi:hypothetical protein
MLGPGRSEPSARPALETRDSAPLAARLAARAPLDPDPYFLAALEMEAKGEASRAEALAALAVRRNPRRADVRLWRLARFLSTGRVPAALQEAATLYGIRPEMTPQMSLLLAEASRDRATRELVASRLAGTPFILDVLRHAAASGLPPQALVELVRHTDLATLPGGVREAQRAVISGLLDAGRYRAAHAAWSTLLPGRRSEIPFDPRFEMPDAAPPFAWTLTTGRAVESVAVPGEGLRVRAFDEAPVTAAAQTLVLDPGHYVLSHDARGSAQGARGSNWRWRISCGGGRDLLDAPVTSTTAGSQPSRAAFVVPTGCDHQLLELRSAGAIVDTREGLLVSRVGITRDGR